MTIIVFFVNIVLTFRDLCLINEKGGVVPMSKWFRKFAVLVMAGLFVASITLTGCTRYANDEQLKTLEETKQAAKSAQQKVSDLQAEKAQLQKKLDAKKAELEKVKQEKEVVKERLSKSE
ncbi:MAG: hypothetical protein GXO76_01935 [Calditrichaeota bacterium]|nr:hypothetical protein [Calditrichota bacterium]